jgi:AcrR family transcriptional regulator
MPLSDCEVRDPRIRRTRQSLQSALRSLLQSKSFEEISVQDITELADVNRATFYDHYTDKFDLLDALIAGGFHALLQDRQISFDGTCPSAAKAIIAATCDYLVLMQEGHAECRGRSSFEPFADAAITTSIVRVLTRAHQGQPPVPSEIAASAASWAIYGAVRQWFRSPNRPPTDVIVPEILALVLPILTQAFTLAPAPVPAVHA